LKPGQAFSVLPAAALGIGKPLKLGGGGGGQGQMQGMVIRPDQQPQTDHPDWLIHEDYALLQVRLCAEKE